MNYVVVFKKENPDEKHFLIFDIRRNAYVRKLSKQHMDDEAFAINSSGRVLAKIDGDNLEFTMCRFPNN